MAITQADSPTSIFEALASRYPRTVAAFSSMPGGEEGLRAVAQLESRWKGLHTQPVAEPFQYVSHSSRLPRCPGENCYDVVIAGGGLGLVAGAALAARGLRVMVFDRERVGAAHREWNISERELGSLVRWGLFTREELSDTVAARYRRGVISFDAEGTGLAACPLQVNGVLDVALDAQKVLDLARRRFLDAGGTILEERRFVRLHMARRGPVASVFEVEGPGGREYYRATLAVDTMGSVSPVAMGLNGGVPFDGVCPTVGTVLQGANLDRSTGDVLVSISPVQGGRQLIWEGFPGSNGETTVYLFYYDQAGSDLAQRQSLLDLFEQYFELLPDYLRVRSGTTDDGRGHSAFRTPHSALHIRPVFGYIPARHGRTGLTAARGFICLGDSAAGQSPLTFCGFGSFVRHIGRTVMLLDYALRHKLLEEKHLRAISPHQANLRIAWVFSRFMEARPGGDPAAVNRIMNVFCRALGEVGQETTLRFLQDRYTLGQYLRIMLTTARYYPKVVPLTARALGMRGVAKWVGDMAYFAADEGLRTGYQLLGPRTRTRVERLAGRLSPAAVLRLRALKTGWEAIR